jgi:hypothetical protein
VLSQLYNSLGEFHQFNKIPLQLAISVTTQALGSEADDLMKSVESLAERENK